MQISATHINWLAFPKVARNFYCTFGHTRPKRKKKKKRPPFFPSQWAYGNHSCPLLCKDTCRTIWLKMFILKCVWLYVFGQFCSFFILLSLRKFLKHVFQTIPEWSHIYDCLFCVKHHTTDLTRKGYDWFWYLHNPWILWTYSVLLFLIPCELVASSNNLPFLRHPCFAILVK